MVPDLGEAVIVAIDHGIHWGVYEGFEDPQETLERVLESGPDGILAGVPFLRRFSDTLASYPSVDVVATLDLLHDSPFPGDHGDLEIHRQVFSVEEAARLDPDAAKVVLCYGRENPAVLEENLAFVARVAEQCRERDVPLVVEPTLWGKLAEDELDAAYLRNAARIAFELGADIVKSPYPGTAESFRPIVEDSPQPVYIAGGPPVDTDREVLEMVAGATDVGARGVMFGRNVWQREDPGAIIDALKAIVHDGASVDAAADRL